MNSRTLRNPLEKRQPDTRQTAAIRKSAIELMLEFRAVEERLEAEGRLITYRPNRNTIIRGLPESIERYKRYYGGDCNTETPSRQRRDKLIEDRNANIFEKRMAGATWEELTAEFGLHKVTLRRICNNYKKTP